MLLCSLLSAVFLLAQQAGSGPHLERFVVETFEPLRYPPLAHQARVSGTVILRVIVDASGKVTQASSLTGHPLLNAASEQNIRTWRFRQNKKGGETYVAYFFELDNGVCGMPCQSSFILKNSNQAHIRIGLPDINE